MPRLPVPRFARWRNALGSVRKPPPAFLRWAEVGRTCPEANRARFATHRQFGTAWQLIIVAVTRLGADGEVVALAQGDQKSMAPDPGHAYATRLEARRAEARALERRDRNLSVARGATGVTAIVSWLALASIPAAVVALVTAALAFFALVVLHESVARRLERARRRVAFYEAAVARMNEDWSGRGETGTRFEEPAHPYAADLDLFGRGSLYERLCAARTHAGQDTLAAWLKKPGRGVEVRDRQGAVAELGPRVDLREDLAVLGAEARRAVDSTALARWAGGAPADLPAGLRLAGFAASGLALGTLAGWVLGGWGSFPFYLATAAVALVTWLARPLCEKVLAGIGRPAQDLQALTEIFDRLGAERFVSPRLARLHARLSADGGPPGRPIAQLRRWLEVHDSKRNCIFAPVAFYLLWDLQWRPQSKAGAAATARDPRLARRPGRARSPRQPGRLRLREPRRSFPRVGGGGAALPRAGARPPAAANGPLGPQRRGTR